MIVEFELIGDGVVHDGMEYPYEHLYHRAMQDFTTWYRFPRRMAFNAFCIDLALTMPVDCSPVWKFWAVKWNCVIVYWTIRKWLQGEICEGEAL